MDFYKKVKLSFICFILIGVIIFMFPRLSNSRFSHPEQRCLYLKSLEIDGLVIKRYRDYKNKGFFTVEIQLADSSMMTLTRYPVYLEGYVHVGDSIIKNSNDFEIKLFKQFNRDSITVLNRKEFDCDYWKKL